VNSIAPRPRARVSAARITGVLTLAVAFPAFPAFLAFLAFLAPASATAAILRFGSSLRIPGSLTTDNLDYQGINTPYGSRVIHTTHVGADTALWNVVVSGGRATAPANGEVQEVSLEGCAQPAGGGPAPLTQIHFQTLAPTGGGAVKVELTSQSFELPVCGQNGVSRSTVSAYKPNGLCIDRGDYVAFNDEGGYVENFYRSGVPYEVIASMRHARMDSFVKGGGTGNGAVLSPSVTGAAEGFAADPHQELLLRATLVTGPKASYCRNGLHS